MTETVGFGDHISNHFKNIRNESNDWFQFVPQSEVMEKLRTSHTQLNRWIDEFPNQIKKYKRKRKVYYRRDDINNLIESFGNYGG